VQSFTTRLSVVGLDKDGKFIDSGINHIGNEETVVNSILKEHTDKETPELVIIDGGKPIARIHTDKDGETWVARHDLGGTVVRIR
jgi:hypothetical protein